ncbi:MAG: hypothetical protein ACLFM0_09615 [Spirochaetales bacterium]
MKRFHYSLEHLLSLRKHAEREAEMTLAEVISRKQELETSREALKTELSRPISRAESGFVDLSLEQVRAHYRVRVERELSGIVEQLSTVDSELESARALFSEKRKARQVLERLRDVREAEHYRLEHRREESELNDIIGSRAARVNASGGTPWPDGDTIV